MNSSKNLISAGKDAAPSENIYSASDLYTEGNLIWPPRVEESSFGKSELVNSDSKSTDKSSCLINVRLGILGGPIKVEINNLWQKFKNQHKDQRPTTLRIYKRGLQVILANIIDGYRSDMELGVPLNPAWFSKQKWSKPGWFNYRRLRCLLDFLAKEGIIETRPGDQRIHKCTRFWLKENPDSKFWGKVIGQKSINSLIVGDAPDLIILRNSRKQCVRFNMKPELQEMAEGLRSWNVLANSASISFNFPADKAPKYDQCILGKLQEKLDPIIDLESSRFPGILKAVYGNVGNSARHNFLHSQGNLPFTCNVANYLFISEDKRSLPHLIRNLGAVTIAGANALVRIFNIDFARGGRFYGGAFQQVPKYFRKFLTINGEPVIEYDFDGFHINMIYALAGTPMVGNPYMFDKKKQPVLRKIAKELFLRAINAKSPVATIISTATFLVDEEPQLLSQLKATSLWTGDLKDTLTQLYNGLVDYHRPIKRYLGSGVGVYLQRLDSHIADRIMLHFCAKGILALPIHDSFLVPIRHGEELKAVMMEVYEKSMQFPIGIDVAW